MHLARIAAPTAAVAFLAVMGGSAAEPTPIIDDAKVVSFVDERLEKYWLKPDEQRFDLIGWAPNVLAGRRLSKESNRPLFLFTMDGRVNTGRC